jgi:hypothetical protein
MSSLIYVFIVLAIGIAVLAEVLVSYQKYQMKKQFTEELERQDTTQGDESKTSRDLANNE